MGGLPVFALLLAVILAGSLALAAIGYGLCRLGSWRDARTRRHYEDDLARRYEEELGGSVNGRALIAQLRQSGF